MLIGACLLDRAYWISIVLVGSHLLDQPAPKASQLALGAGPNMGVTNYASFIFLLFSCFLMFVLCFNYSKIANHRFLIDSNTFWMISGTSKFLSKSGPVDQLITTKLLQTIQKMWKHPWNELFFISENLKISKLSEVLCAWPHVFFSILIFEHSIVCGLLFIYFWFFDFIIWWNLEIMKSRRRGMTWD